MIDIQPFTDKNGNSVSKGDILFYSESLPYAESIHLVEEIEGVLYGRTVVGNWDGKYNRVNDDTPVELKYYQRFPYTDGILIDAIKIGNIKDSPEFMTVEYAEKHYPLSNYTKEETT